MASRTAPTGSHELHTMGDNSITSNAASNIDDDEAQNHEIEFDSLPPTDRGKAAYLVLLGCTVLQAPIWGRSSLNLLSYYIRLLEKLF